MLRRSIMGMVTLAVMLSVSVIGVRADRVNVRINGERIHFLGPQPREINGHTYVPLRGVLEHLGANLNWEPDTERIVAMNGDTEIALTIGSRIAKVDGRSVRMDVPPIMIAGRAMVPLRFMSEALGAEVGWSEATNTVLINTEAPMATAGMGDDRSFQSFRSARLVELSAGTVIPVILDENLSSNDSRPGDVFTATVSSGSEAGDLPDGTRFEGVVREAVPARRGRPGMLSVEFRRVLFPNGERRPVTASVSSLDSKAVTHTGSGTLMARGSRRNEQWKWVGIGAGSGYLISTIFGGNRLLDSLLGGGAGYLYNQLQRRGAKDVYLHAGTEIGVRLDRRFAFSPEWAAE